LEALAENCQLRIEKRKGNVFNDFEEAEIKFMPTYKFNKNDREYTAHVSGFNVNYTVSQQ